jgi:hypothetical protein
MPVDFANLVYSPNYDTWSRLITITPIASRPGELPYEARGIFDEEQLNVAGMDDTIISDQRVILDILEQEFSVLPLQRDIVDIPADGTVPAAGTFEIIDKSSNGGGETTLVLRQIVRAAP